MCGGTGTTTQKTTIPPEILARYNAVNAQAQEAAKTPFQQYSTDPNAFVAGINQQQQQGIGGVNAAANQAQPAFQTGMGMTAYGAGPVNAEQYSAAGVQQYMNPYISNVANTTAAQMQNLFGQQAQQLKGGAIQAGAFGGDRAGIAAGNLANQQALGMGQTMAGIYGGGFNQAQQQFNQQQGVNLQAGQANAARMLQAGQQYAGLGAAAQQSALQGAQAQIGAGTMQQQTEQAGKTALYNQFLQQQAYPFQIAQFLANIAEGTGALSGSTTTTTQPTSFFGSDRNLKDDIQKIGTADNGLPIYSFTYKNDPHKQMRIGFMADEVEHVHPEAVGLAGGHKAVDYEQAVKPSKESSQGGLVAPHHMGEGFAGGGLAYDPYDPTSLENLVNSQQRMYANLEGHHVPMSRSLAGGLGKHGRVPTADVPVGRLMTSGSIPQLPESGMRQSVDAAAQISDVGTKGRAFYDWMKSKNAPAASTVPQPSTATPSYTPSVAAAPTADASTTSSVVDNLKHLFGMASGGRIHKNYGGGFDPIHDNPFYQFNSPTGLSALAGGTGFSGGMTGSIVPSDQMGDHPEPSHTGQPRRGGLLSGVQDGARVGPNTDRVFGGGMSNPATGESGTYGGGSDTSGMFSRGGLADGGTPEDLYSDQTTDKLNIPNVKNTHGLMTAQNPTGASTSGSGLSDILGAAKLAGSVGSIGSTIASFLPLLLAHGGAAEHRRGYEDGGTPETQYTPEFFKQKALESAKKYGIDPTDYTKLIQGESGFTLNSGDDNSSHGLLQMHVAGASPKYPGAGLGDDYLAAKNPELAKSGSPEQKGAYLKAPENQADIMDFDAQYIKERGAKPWTVARTQGLFGAKDLPAERSIPAAATSTAPTPQAAAPAEKKGGFGDLLTEQNIIPLLTGLGAMASSPSRYLGSAVLQGLGAGAQSYAGLQGKLADIEQTKQITEGIKSDVALKGLFMFNGVPHVLAIINGQRVPMNATEYNQLKSEGRAPPIDPNGSEVGPQIVSSGVAGGAPSPTIVAPEKPTIVPLPAPKPEVASAIHLDDNDVNEAMTATEKLANMPQEQRLLRKDRFSQQFELADQIKSQQQNQFALGHALASLPTEGALSAGPYAPVFAKAQQNLNGLARMIGLQDIYNGEDLSKTEEASKVLGRLKAQAAGALDQRSYAALEDLVGNFPSLANSPTGKAELMADMMTQSQREMDKQEFFRQWQDAARKNVQTGLGGGDFSRLTGEEAATAFNKKYGVDYYNEEKEHLKQMFKDESSYLKPDGTPRNVFDVLTSGEARNLGQSKKAKDFLASQYGGPKILRYFNLGQ